MLPWERGFVFFGGVEPGISLIRLVAIGHMRGGCFLAMFSVSPSRNSSFLPACLALVGALLFSPGTVHGEVRLPAIFSDHMVLRHARNVPFWGTAAPGESVTVTLGDLSVRTVADANGRWSTVMDLSRFDRGPCVLTVCGENRLTVKDVLVGEVWLAAGQSNMEFPLLFTTGADREIAESADPALREFRVARNASDSPAEDCKGEWVVAAPETSGKFSAVAYYFAKNLRKALGVPVGIVNASVGGTPIEVWTSPAALDTVPELKASRERLWATIKDYRRNKDTFVEGLAAWITDNGREDKPVADVSRYAGGDVSAEGWISVKCPGIVSAPGLPETGVVWLRKEIDISNTGSSLPLVLPLDGYESVYWNGRLIKQTSWQDFPGLGYVRRSGPYDIPAKDLKRGKNVLAIRLYEPAGPAKFTGEAKAGAVSLAGAWQAAVEKEFPALDARKTVSAPVPPPLPPDPQYVAGYFFNGMIQPLIPYAISGVIWYQGEFNVRRACQYQTSFPLLISDWRKQWNQGDFPFYFCQLAGFLPKKSEPGDSLWAELRDAQSQALKVPDTGQAVLIDVGEAGDIHPKNKRDAGNRLASIALANSYGKDLPFSGPVFQSMKIADGRVILSFRHTEGGLVAKPLPATYDVKTKSGETAPLVRNSPGGGLEGFSICGSDHKWVWADAEISGDSVIVRSDKVPSPVSVRYAWADNPTCNLFNGTGFPAAPFRTDEEPLTTRNALY